MRPRVFPAEDVHQRFDELRLVDASMRPRVFPAEDDRPQIPVVASGVCFNEAAGIPRGRRDDAVQAGPFLRASMRPRVFPAEDYRTRRRAPSPVRRFNEAAGIPRGRHQAGCFPRGWAARLQ